MRLSCRVMEQGDQDDEAIQQAWARASFAGPTAIAFFCLSARYRRRGPAGSGHKAQGPLVLPTLRVEGKARATDGYAAKRSGTATKTDTPLIDVPQSVTVVTKEAIRIFRCRACLMWCVMCRVCRWRRARAITTRRCCGNASTADFFVDGIRDDVEYFRDLYNAERVEALGLSAMIFGRGGGSVINRVTKVADFETAREVTLPNRSIAIAASRRMSIRPSTMSRAA